MTTTLATVAELRQHMGIGDSYDDAQLTRALDAAAAWIESTEGCDRTFAVASASKVFDPVRAGVVRVPDLVSVTTIAVDTAGNRSYSTALTSSDYDLLPYDGPPYGEIRSRTLAGRRLTPGQLVQVTGTFGYTEDGGVPKPVKQAALLLAARWHRRHEAPFGVLAAPDIGAMRVLARDPDVSLLLAPYRRTAGWVVAV